MSVKLETYGAPASVKKMEWKDNRNERLRPDGGVGSQNGAFVSAKDEPSTASSDSTAFPTADAEPPTAVDLNGKTHYTPAQSPAGGDMSRGEDLLRRIAGQDEAAFDELYQEYGRRIFGYLRTLLKNHADAEDILQEVMIVVLKKGSACENKENPLGWLFGIARNKAYSHLHRPLPAGGSDPDVQIPDPSQEIEREFIAKESVQKALHRLSPKHRDVVELLYFGDLSYIETSQAIGCPIGTVKSRLYYAQEKLFRILKKDWGNEEWKTT